MTFASREDAGAKLGAYLLQQGITADVVLGLPRGGVVVAAGVADVLHLPLDLVVVRKIGHPQFREFAVGALAEGDVILLDNAAIERTHAIRAQLEAIINEERVRLEDYILRFHIKPPPDLRDRVVLIVDDGLATGATTEAAVHSVKKRAARIVIVAVPVASDNAVARLRASADKVVATLIDPGFDAVGRYYERFPQTTDEEVIALLQSH